MTQGEFCTRLRKSLRRATDAEWGAIQRELMGHVEDRTEDFLSAGCGAEEAQIRAVASMGEPEEIGAALNAQLSNFWRVMIWVGTLAAGLLCWQMLSYAYFYTVPTLYEFCLIQTQPENHLSAYWMKEVETYPEDRETDARACLGNDTLWVYRVGLDPERGLAQVRACLFDERPDGFVGWTTMDYVAAENQAGERYMGDGGGDAIVRYWAWTDIPVEPTDTHVTLRCERFGEDLALEVPLPWEAEK